MTAQSSHNRPRLVVLEDHNLFAESLDIALTMEGYDVRRPVLLEHARSQTALLSIVIRLRPRVVLLDLDLGDLGDGAALIAPLTRAGAMVVVVTASRDEARWGHCLQQGARRVLSKTAALHEVRATVRRLTHGFPVMDVAERERLVQMWRQERAGDEVVLARLGHLTVGERQVLGHLMHGDSVRDIARLRVVAEATVRSQVKSILAKLEVSSQLAAVGLAHRVGWRPPNH